jgi:hypothetical protein
MLTLVCPLIYDRNEISSMNSPLHSHEPTTVFRNLVVSSKAAVSPWRTLLDPRYHETFPNCVYCSTCDDVSSLAWEECIHSLVLFTDAHLEGREIGIDCCHGNNCQSVADVPNSSLERHRYANPVIKFICHRASQFRKFGPSSSSSLTAPRVTTMTSDTWTNCTRVWKEAVLPGICLAEVRTTEHFFFN